MFVFQGVLDSDLALGQVAMALAEIRQSWVEIGLLLSLPQVDSDEDLVSVQFTLADEKWLMMKMHVTEVIYCACKYVVTSLGFVFMFVVFGVVVRF